MSGTEALLREENYEAELNEQDLNQVSGGVFWEVAAIAGGATILLGIAGHAGMHEINKMYCDDFGKPAFSGSHWTCK